MSTVAEIKAAIKTLSPAKRAELERWLRAQAVGDNAEMIPVRESDLDPEADSLELEAELLKAVRGPHALFSQDELRRIADRARSEYRRQNKR